LIDKNFIILFCIFVQIPKRHRDGIRLRPCRQYDMRLESDGSVALIVSGVLARRHAGVYTCTVTNEMGQVSSSARVSVKSRPSSSTSSSAAIAEDASDHDAIITPGYNHHHHFHFFLNSRNLSRRRRKKRKEKKRFFFFNFLNFGGHRLMRGSLTIVNLCRRGLLLLS
jgi:hypothetical protein